MKVLGWLSTGHWPKKMRFPNGIPRTGWPPYEIVSVDGGAVGSYTLHYNGEMRLYDGSGHLINDSDPGVNWALQWANTPTLPIIKWGSDVRLSEEDARARGWA